MQENSKGEEGRPKVRVDEEWKKAAAQEKEELRKQEEEKKRAGRERGAERRGLPEPTIEGFMAGLYTQTLIALGELENPLTQKAEKSIDEAALLIDTIAMLQTKTQASLTPEEGSYVQNLLTDLRLRYVRVTGEPDQQEGDQPPTTEA